MKTLSSAGGSTHLGAKATFASYFGRVDGHSERRSSSMASLGRFNLYFVLVRRSAATVGKFSAFNFGKSTCLGSVTRSERSQLDVQLQRDSQAVIDCVK